MQIKIDAHTHTLASTHAYSTVLENAEFAKKNGLDGFGITDHTPPIQDAPDILHFMNLHVLDRQIDGVELLRGAELNIVNYKGGVYLDKEILKRLDYAIASFHDMALTPGSKAENTAAYLGAMDNPYVAIIGHPEDGRVPVDFEQLVLAARSTKTLLEINNSSLRAAYYRLNTRENMIEMLRLCEQYGVAVSMGTDAHFAPAVGRFDETLELLEEIHFPQELVANLSVEKFKMLIGGKKA